MAGLRKNSAWLLAMAVAGVGAGCRGRAAATPPVVAPPAQPALRPAPPTARGERAGRTVVFTGACDASAAVPLGPRLLAVADDEDNVLRIYDAETGGAPLHAVDVSPDLPLKRRKRARSPELDLEAATLLDGTALWLSSHGRKRAGKRASARLMFFGTSLPAVGQPIHVVGTPYEHLLDDFLASGPFRSFDLGAAADRPPKEPGGLNIEGLTARTDGKSVYIGFRNPIPGGRALLVPLMNPRAVLDGARAELGPPVLLDLAGLGVRGLSRWRRRYLIAAGHFADAKMARLYVWDGRGEALLVRDQDLSGFNVEAFFTPEQREDFMVLSDDGAIEIGGTKCKNIRDPAAKRFRGRWLRLPSKN